MTRLKTEDISSIEKRLVEYDREIKFKTGYSLWEVACKAAGLEAAQINNNVQQDLKIRIVPIQSGLGVISGFTETIRSIITYLGFKARCTSATDIAGMAEAFEEKADIIFSADDQRFVVFGLKKRFIVDNTPATAQGFVKALELMAKGLKAKPVLVLGCGPVGQIATDELLKSGANVFVYDIDPIRSQLLVEKYKNGNIEIEKDFNKALEYHHLYIDATTAADLIGKHHFRKETLVVAPGMPCGITNDARKVYPDQILHDPLQIGVATMLSQSIIELNA